MNRQSMQKGWVCQIVGRRFVVKAGSELLDSSLLSFLVVSVVRSSEFFSSLDFVEKAGVDGVYRSPSIRFPGGDASHASLSHAFVVVVIVGWCWPSGAAIARKMSCCRH